MIIMPTNISKIAATKSENQPVDLAPQAPPHAPEASVPAASSGVTGPVNRGARNEVMLILTFLGVSFDLSSFKNQSFGAEIAKTFKFGNKHFPGCDANSFSPSLYYVYGFLSVLYISCNYSPKD